MKKAAIYSVLLALVVMVPFSSCKKDEEEKKNELKYDGKTFGLSAGDLDYYGDYYSSGFFNFDVYLYSNTSDFPGEDNAVYFELFSSSATELVAGTYTFNATSYSSNSFSYGDFVVEKDAFYEYGEVTAGTVKVGRSGDSYEFTINCDTDTGKKITGYYKGPLVYEDHSGLKSGKYRQK
jgi:hypothetical protein